MGVITRARSPFLHIWVPGLSSRYENSKIPIGVTPTERKANLEKAELIISKRQLDAATRAAGLPVKDDTPEAAAVTFRTYAARYLTDVVPSHRGAYREKQILPRLVAAFGDMALSEKASRWVEAVKAWRMTRLATPSKVKHYGGLKGKAHTFAKPSATTVNREVGLLRQILRAAVADKLIDISPLTRFGALPAPPIRRRIATPDEETKILAQLPPDDRAIYILGVDGLVRLGDCFDVKRSDRRGAELDIRYPKNGDPLTIRMSTRLQAALDAVPVDPRFPDWYFPRRRHTDNEQNRSRGFAKDLEKACERAGVPYGKKNRGITFHWATRMTGATRMIRNGGDGAVKDVAQLGGWKTLDVLMQIYQQTTTDDLARLVELANPAANMPAPPPPPSTRQARRAASRLRRVK